MKTTKNMIRVIFSLVMFFTLCTAPQTGKAQESNTDTCTVTLRIEDVDKTIVKETKVTIQESDLTKIDEVYVSETEDGKKPMLTSGLSAASVVAKYAIDQNLAVTFATSSYGGCNVSEIQGQTHEDEKGSWVYCVNNVAGSVSMDLAPVKDGDSVVLYHSDCYDPTVGWGLYTKYAYFEKASYETTVNQATEINILGETGEYDENYAPVIASVTEGTITVSGPKSDTFTGSGKQSLVFTEPGVYQISFEKQIQKDGKTLSEYSRAFTTVTVKKANITMDQPTTPSDTSKKVSAPAKPKKVKVVAGKKKATITWKKNAKAKGYIIYRSTKKKGTYKAIKTIKKASTTKFVNKKLSSKKTYYYKVKSYVMDGNKKVTSKFSEVVRVKIK